MITFDDIGGDLELRALIKLGQRRQAPRNVRVYSCCVPEQHG